MINVWGKLMEFDLKTDFAFFRTVFSVPGGTTNQLFEFICVEYLTLEFFKG